MESEKTTTVEEMYSKYISKSLDLTQYDITEIGILLDYVFNKYLSAMAETDNIKKRNVEDRKRIEHNATTKAMNGIIDFYQGFSLMLNFFENSPDLKNAIPYVQPVTKSLEKVLINNKITKIDTTIPFDSDIHECISIVKNPDMESGLITQVVSDGFLIDGKTVIIPAKVIVNMLS